MKPAGAAIPYARLAALKDGFIAIPEAQRDHVACDIIVSHADTANHGAISLWVEDPPGTRVPIAVSPRGVIALPDRPDWVTRQLMVHSDQASHSLNVEAGVTIRIPGGQTLSADYLRTGVAQAQATLRAGARQIGGYMAQFLVPTLRSVRITLVGCCGGTATVAPGGAVLTQDRAGVVSVPGAALTTATMFSLSAPATLIDPAPDP